MTYGIPAGGYLNNAAASISIDGSSPVTIDSDLGGFGSTTSSDLYLWTSGALGAGTHTWTITSQGNAVNVYGLWITGGPTSTTCSTTNGQPSLTLYPIGTDESSESGLSVTINGVVIAPEGTSLTAIDWNWGDGTTLLGCVYFPETHTYAASGTYTVVVTTTFTDGSQLQASEEVTVGGTVPGSPTNVTATATDGQAKLSWTPPGNDGGSLITSYSIVATPAPTCGIEPFVVPASSNAEFINCLQDGTQYTFSVAAVNGVGPGIAATSNPVTPSSLTMVSNTITFQVPPDAQSLDNGVVANCPVGSGTDCYSLQQEISG